MYNHPDSEQLDRLRAGLLDDTTGRKAALEQHLAGCPACRERAAPWRKLASRLDGALELPGDELEHARQAALAAGSRHTHRALIPYAAAATLLIAVTLGIFGLPTDKVNSPHAVTRTAQAVPDTYEDLDFYLWLASQDKGHPAKTHANPNNT